MADTKKKTAGRPRRRERKSVPRGHAHIQSTFNNTLVTISDPNGNVLSWSSAGILILRDRARVRPMPRR